MSTMAKVFVVLNLILALIFVTISGVLFAHEEHWKEKYDSSQELVSQWRSDYDTLEEDSSREITGLENDKTQALAQVGQLQSEVTTKNNQIKDLKASQAELREDNLKWRHAHEALAEKWDSTEQRLQSVIAELDRRTEEAQRVRKAKTAADEQIVSLTALLNEANRRVDRQSDELNIKQNKIAEQIALLENIKRDSPKAYRLALGKGSKVPPAVRGKVLGVDTETRIVLLSVGREDEVEPNMKFHIFRGADFVADVVVDKVLSQKCSARMTEIMEKPIQVGDEAATETGLNTGL